MPVLCLALPASPPTHHSLFLTETGKEQRSPWALTPGFAFSEKTSSLDPHQNQQQQLVQTTANQLDRMRKVKRRVRGRGGRGLGGGVWGEGLGEGAGEGPGGLPATSLVDEGGGERYLAPRRRLSRLGGAGYLQSPCRPINHPGRPVAAETGRVEGAAAEVLHRSATPGAAAGTAGTVVRGKDVPSPRPPARSVRGGDV